MIKAVLFDMDGILLDSESFYMQGTISQMKSWGYQGSIEKIYTIIGTSMEETYDILYHLLNGKKPKEEIAQENDLYFTKKKPIRAKEVMRPWKCLKIRVFKWRFVLLLHMKQS